MIGHIPCVRRCFFIFSNFGYLYGTDLGAVRLIQYIVYNKSFYTSYGIVAVEYDVKSMGLFDLIITFLFPLNLTFQRS